MDQCQTVKESLSVAPTTLEPVASVVAYVNGSHSILWSDRDISRLPNGTLLCALPDAAAIIAKLTRERESWEKLFGEVALSLKCLPSCFVDDNSHVLRVAKEAMEQLATATQERNSFQDQCIRMRHERHAEKEQLAALISGQPVEDPRDAKIASLQAKIDALMLEYCPDEITLEQMEEWASHQVRTQEVE